MIEIWADIGGTFTDCLLRGEPQSISDRSQNRPKTQDTLKTLSSGLVSASLVSVPSPDRLIVSLPAKFAPDGFWNGAELQISIGPAQPGGSRPSQADRYLIQECRLTGEKTTSGILVEVRIDQPHQLPRAETAATIGLVTLTLNAHLEAPVLGARLLLNIPLRDPMPPIRVRLGTTRGTNALLTRQGASTALLITEGFADLLKIGTQDRPDLFSLNIVKPEPLPQHVVEIPGRLAADGSELVPLDEPTIVSRLKRLRGGNVAPKVDAGPEVLAICLLHAHQNDAHEKRVEQLAMEAGFKRVARSTGVAPLPRIVPRAETTTLNAYLQPVLDDYVQRVLDQFGGPNNCHLRWMTSSGNLVASDSFRGRDSVLSGPAGGVVALAQLSKQRNIAAAVGLDMGGTSTDVCRYVGQIGRRQESRIGGIRVLTPMMDIHTVAAGGGSICAVRDGRLWVGPESAGADPGPACYGRGGPLTVTDVNVLLGRIAIDRFPFVLNKQAAQEQLEIAHAKILASRSSEHSKSPLSLHDLAEGFLQIAVTEMAEAVRVVTTAEGCDVRDMTLVGFGGAAGGHLCRVAHALGMSTVIDHPHAGILSAVGIGQAPVGRIKTSSLERVLCKPTNQSLSRQTDTATAKMIRERLADLREQCIEQLSSQERISIADIENNHSLAAISQVDVRYQGTEASLPLTAEPLETLGERMDLQYRKIFGYDRPNMNIESVVVRCEVRLNPDEASPSIPAKSIRKGETHGPASDPKTLDRDELTSGDIVHGPAIIAGEHSVLVVESDWTGSVQPDGAIEVVRRRNISKATTDESIADDTVEMEIAVRRIQGIAESMGEVIRRTSVSVNVKERRDYSCAVFLGDGSLVANAPHVPVHLGAMGHTVRHLQSTFPVMHPGDCYISNDPFAGGSHLPDITVVTPVFCSGQTNTPDFFVASRCHHAEIGGIVPGSMNPGATCLADEGIVIRSFALVKDGKHAHEDLRRLLRNGPFPSRSVDENMADIAAAEAAGREGASEIETLAKTLSLPRLNQLLRRLLHVAGDATTKWIKSLEKNDYHFEDQLDDGSKICVTLSPSKARDRLRIDFTGSAGVHQHGFNATPSIVTAAVLYVLRCVSPNDLPLCDGVLDKIDLIIPTGMLNPPGNDSPEQCPAVVAGNVETSNRVVDCLLGALGIAAASQGTMNNLLIGNDTFGYYETIGGGAGATATSSGADAVHTHMTNTRITDPEIIESRLPVRLWQFGVRKESGGVGHHNGGDGMIRELEFLQPLTLSMITSRRCTRPYGMAGGEPGKSGTQTITTNASIETLPPSFTRQVATGERLKIQTPGGGGFGESD